MEQPIGYGAQQCRISVSDAPRGSARQHPMESEVTVPLVPTCLTNIRLSAATHLSNDIVRNKLSVASSLSR